MSEYHGCCPTTELAVGQELARERERTPRDQNFRITGSRKRQVFTIEVTDGTRPGFVEVRFPTKPSTRSINLLKSKRFRWSKFNACWYGWKSRLPKSYRRYYVAEEPPF